MEKKKTCKALAVTGPTACGKTAFAVELARRFGGEIVGADSRQVYRGLDIGSGKDLSEYGEGPEAVPFHMIDVAEPGTPFNLAEYVKGAQTALAGVAERGRLPILAGGSALYVDALLKGYELPGGPADEELRSRLAGAGAETLAKELAALGEEPEPGCGEAENRSRLMRRLELASSRKQGSGRGAGFDAEWLVLGVRYDRKEIHRRIEARLDARLEEGMIAEVERLHASGTPWERLEWFGLEYRQVSVHLQGKIGRQEMRDSLLAKIRQFAKRQDSWFRKIEREGVKIYWFDKSSFEAACALTRKFLAGEPLPEPEFRLMNVRFGPKTS